MSKAEKFEYSDKLNRHEAVEYLKEIIEGLSSPRLKLEGDGQSVVLVTHDTVKLKVKAESEEDKNKIKVEVSWKIPPSPTGTSSDAETDGSVRPAASKVKPAAKRSSEKVEQ